METRVIIGPPSIGMSILNLLSLAIVYAKISNNLYMKWWVALLPSNIFFVYSLIRVMIFLIFALRSQGHWRRLELRLTLLWKVSQLIMLISSIIFTFSLENIMQEIEDSANPESLKILFEPLFISIAVILLTYATYSWLHSVFQSHFIHGEEHETDKTESVSIYRMIMNSVLSILGNSTAICAGGSCNNIYISTLSAFFSAFGIPIVEYVRYLSFIAFIFVGLSLVSLYSVQKSVLYPPFIISFLGSVAILSDLVFSIHDYLTYVGNVFVICGAIWNARLDKFSFAAAKKKQKSLNILPFSTHHS